jgi:hypothetical protein
VHAYYIITLPHLFRTLATPYRTPLHFITSPFSLCCELLCRRLREGVLGVLCGGVWVGGVGAAVWMVMMMNVMLNDMVYMTMTMIVTIRDGDIIDIY